MVSKSPSQACFLPEALALAFFAALGFGVDAGLLEGRFIIFTDALASNASCTRLACSSGVKRLSCPRLQGGVTSACGGVVSTLVPCGACGGVGVSFTSGDGAGNAGNPGTAGNACCGVCWRPHIWKLVKLPTADELEEAAPHS